MTDAEIMAGLQSVAEEHLEFQGDLAMDTVLVHELQLDSIRLLTFVVETENHFQICLEEGDEEGIETAGDLLRLVKGRFESGEQADPR
jgi:acyl carrier protein